MKPLTVKQAREDPLASLCLTIARLYQHDKTAPSGEIMAILTRRLIACESQPGGPYSNLHNQVDFSTNLAIGYLFACLGIPLPNVTQFITTHQAQATTPQLKRLLAKYIKLHTKTLIKKPLPNKSHHSIYQNVTKQLRLLKQPDKSLALAFLQRIYVADTTHEIALLPTFFANSLITSPPALPLQTLGEANIYCWIAYSIYDQLLDDQPTAQYLPVANIAMRAALQKYQELFPIDHSFQHTTQGTFTTMDHANAWEVSTCRCKRAGESLIIPALPRYGNFNFLAQRSYGHILGPLAIMALLKLPQTSVKQIEQGLHHYLIARQLSDDIHDWKEDIEAGHISSVVAIILRHLKIQPGSYHLPNLVTTMQTDFWQHSMETSNALISHHTRLSRQHFTKSDLIKKQGELLGLLTRLDELATQSTNEHLRYQTFLQAYQKAEK